MQFSKTTVIQLGAMVFFVAFSGWAFHRILVQPKIERIEALTRQIRILDSQSEKMDSQLSNLSAIKKKLKNEEALLKEAEGKLSTFSQEMLSTSEIKPLLKDNPLLLEHSNKGAYSKNVWRISAGDSRQEILDAVSALEKTSPFIKLRSLALTSKESELFQVEQAQIELEVIYQPL